MKQFFVAFFIMLACEGFSQETAFPIIKKGTKLNYSLVNNEGSLPLTITIDSLATAYIRFVWSAPNQGTGTWVEKQKSIENGNSGLWSQLEPDREVILDDNQTVVIFSKAQWAGIQKDKKTGYDMISYSLKTATPQQQIKLNGKPVDALYLENENGSSKIWLLNNPSFPAILKIEGNTAGPDVELKSVE